MRIHVISKRISLDSALFLMKRVKIVSTQFTYVSCQLLFMSRHHLTTFSCEAFSLASLNVLLNDFHHKKYGVTLI